jgi:hypothetical protein
VWVNQVAQFGLGKGDGRFGVNEKDAIGLSDRAIEEWLAFREGGCHVVEKGRLPCARFADEDGHCPFED